MSIEFVQTWRPSSLQISIDMLYILVLTSEKEITSTGSLSLSSDPSFWVFCRLEEVQNGTCGNNSVIKVSGCSAFCTPVIVLIMKFLLHHCMPLLANKTKLTKANGNYKNFCKKKERQFYPRRGIWRKYFNAISNEIGTILDNYSWWVCKKETNFANLFDECFHSWSPFSFLSFLSCHFSFSGSISFGPLISAKTFASSTDKNYHPPIYFLTLCLRHLQLNKWIKIWF